MVSLGEKRPSTRGSECKGSCVIIGANRCGAIVAEELPLTEAESLMAAVVSSQFRAMTLTVLSLTSAFPLKGRVEEDIKRGLGKLEGRTEERSGGVTS